MSVHSTVQMIGLLMVLISFKTINAKGNSKFTFKEATVHGIRAAFNRNELTSRQLVRFYLGEIKRLNPILRGVIEVNPDVLYLADKADRERKAHPAAKLPALHGIPILIKDNIATKDKLNTTAGSFALLGSVVPEDAGVVKRLKKAGAIVLGKASMSEWAHERTAPSGWNARAGQALSPYVKSVSPCGSSTGSATSVAANMAAVTLGTETSGSILCPSSNNSVVGIKPTVGLTSRAGVIPVTPRQDTVGPICRTVSDAVYVLDAIVGYDPDDVATRKASKYIPRGGYLQFLKHDGLKGKRLGIALDPFVGFYPLTVYKTFAPHFQLLRHRGAVLVNIVADFTDALITIANDMNIARDAEFKLFLNAYLKKLVKSPVRSLADVIAFNDRFPQLEKTKEFGQETFLRAQKTNGIGELEKRAIFNLTMASKNAFEKLMRMKKLDALVTPFGKAVVSILAVGGYPGISVPAGYYRDGSPFGICFGGLKGSEPKLIEIAYGFEQATKIRKPPSFLQY